MSSFSRDNAVKDYLAEETGKEFGLTNTPSDYPEKPYGIVSSFGGPTPEGDFESRMANRDVRYAIRCVGIDERQVGWLRDRVEIAMVAGSPWPDAQWVLLESAGAIVPDGEGLYSCVDTYMMRI